MDPFGFQFFFLGVYVIRRRRRLQRHHIQRRFHQHPIIASRLLKGEFHLLFLELREHEDKFFNYFRLSIRSFDELLGKVEHRLQHCNMFRMPITPTERLAVTLRYLASGNTFTDLHYSYRIGVSTIGQIVAEVCTVIWDVLQEDCLQFPTTEKLFNIAADFEVVANFPHCIGCIDGKHVRIISPEHSGSLFNNYKKYFSVVLLAMCDAHYRFTYISVGSCGTESDSAIFKDSRLFSDLNNGQIQLPQHKQLPNTVGETLPYVILGDAAFGISNHVLRPYARSNMTYKKKIFNYRLSRARRYIECTFGILSNKFRIFHRPLNTSLETTLKIVKACCILHNFIRDRDGFNEEHTLTIEGFGTNPNNNFNEPLRVRTGDAVRDKFANYFISPEGSVPWQDRCIF